MYFLPFQTHPPLSGKQRWFSFLVRDRYRETPFDITTSYPEWYISGEHPKHIHHRPYYYDFGCHTVFNRSRLLFLSCGGQSVQSVASDNYGIRVLRIIAYERSFRLCDIRLCDFRFYFTLSRPITPHGWLTIRSTERLSTRILLISYSGRIRFRIATVRGSFGASRNDDYRRTFGMKTFTYVCVSWNSNGKSGPYFRIAESASSYNSRIR